MLLVIDKKGQPVARLNMEDEAALVAAFTRSKCTQAERDLGAGVVRRHQIDGHWFACDCLGADAAERPVLTPVARTHVRRAGGRPDHADGCAFEIDQADMKLQAKRLREKEPANGFRLAREIAAHDEEDGDEAVVPGAQARRGPCKAYYRSRLSQLLFKLLHDAAVNRVGLWERDQARQRKAMHAAARGITLGRNPPLASVLETTDGDLRGARCDALGQWAGSGRLAGGRTGSPSSSRAASTAPRSRARAGRRSP